MQTAPDIFSLGPGAEKSIPGLVPVPSSQALQRIDEEAAVRQAQAIGNIDYVFFRRFADERSSQVAAYVIDNSKNRFNEDELSRVHHQLWLNGTAPLLYVNWQTRVDVLSCARGPDFWQHGNHRYNPAETISTAGQVSAALEQMQERFSFDRLTTGTFWDDPENFKLANADKAAHKRLISAVVDTDRAIQGASNPVFRRLLLLTVLIKYLEDRKVFPDGWFAQCHKGAQSFFEVLRMGTADEVRDLLTKLERKFNGDVFSLPEDTHQRLTTKELHKFADLVEAKTIGEQRYLWEQFSFRHIPVEVLSHLYQRFTQKGKGAVFTPPFLANLLLDYALPYDYLDGNEKILDPTCGSGVFLVGAFRRLIHVWQNRNGWKRPDVTTLKNILKQSVYGVELQEEAVHLSAFSLALAVCDALQPEVIWKDLRFDKLLGTNLFHDDFFEWLKKARNSTDKPAFSVILGNPPFLSKFSEAAREVNESKEKKRIPVPDNQMAYLIAEQAMPLLHARGRLCLLQPAGFLYNEKARPFQKSFLANHMVETVLDFTSIRGLYDGADPKTVALVVSKQVPIPSHRIWHYTFRRTFSVKERITFELDHYDRHEVLHTNGLENPWIWRTNLLGGGRLFQFATRLRAMPTLSGFFVQRGWDAGEGFITGKTGKREVASWLTGQPLLPTTALTIKGIDRSKVSTVEASRFTASRTEARYAPPLALIKEHESLPCAFWNDGFLAYKHKIVGVHSSHGDAPALRRFCDEFSSNRDVLRAFCLLLGTQALVGKATAILKRDIDALPWPDDNNGWSLSVWEKILCEDTVKLTSEFVRLGQASTLLKKKANEANLQEYARVFVDMLGTVYTNLRHAKSILINGLVCQLFCFGKVPEIDWLGQNGNSLHKLIYIKNGEALRTTRVLRLYDENSMLIVKPDRLRYWIRSSAIRDADETLLDLRKQGY